MFSLLHQPRFHSDLCERSDRHRNCAGSACLGVRIRVAFGVVVDGNGFRVAAYDVFAGTGGGIAGTSEETARRVGGLTHDESFFLLLNLPTAQR